MSSDTRKASGFLTRFDKTWPVQLQKMARSLKFWISRKTRNCTIHVAKTKALISCAIIIPPTKTKF